MKRINKLILNGCGYTVLILSIFYLFAAISGFTSRAIAPKQFILILTFGFIISGAEFMYEQIKLRRIYKCLVHYLVLLIAFCVIFIFSGNIAAQRPSAIFVAIILYTVLYFFILALVYLARRALDRADTKLNSKTEKTKASKTNTYKFLYKED